MKSNNDFQWTDDLVKNMIWQKLPVPEHYNGNLQKCLDEFKSSEYASQFQSPQPSKDVEAVKEAAKDFALLTVWINKEWEDEETFYELIAEQSFIAGAKWAEQAKEYWENRCKTAEKAMALMGIPKNFSTESGNYQFRNWQDAYGNWQKSIATPPAEQAKEETNK